MIPPLKSTPGCPPVGWQWLRAIDLHDDEGRDFGNYDQCEFCAREQIRFVHYLRHTDWRGEIAVGRICADALSGDARVDNEERRLRNRAQRKANFIKLKSWKTSAKGNYWIEYQDHHIIVIRYGNGQCRLRIDGQLGKFLFKDLNAAKAKAFDVVMRKVEQGR